MNIKEVAYELGIDPGRMSKGRQKEAPLTRTIQAEDLTAEQREIRRLQKELKEAQLEHDMDPMLTHVCGPKKTSASSPGEAGGNRLHKREPRLVSHREDVQSAPGESQQVLLLAHTSYHIIVCRLTHTSLSGEVTVRVFAI